MVNYKKKEQKILYFTKERENEKKTVYNNERRTVELWAVCVRGNFIVLCDNELPAAVYDGFRNPCSNGRFDFCIR